MMRRRRRGIIGTVATTAAIAGTATAVSGKVSQHQAAKQQEKAAQQQAGGYDQVKADLNTVQAQQLAGATGGAPSTTDQLQQLAALKASGALTDAEFTAAKAKLLGI